MVRSAKMPASCGWLRSRPPLSLRRRLQVSLGVVLLITLIIIAAGVSYFVYRTEQAAWQGRQSEATRNAVETVAIFVQHLDDALTLVAWLDREDLTAEPQMLRDLLQQNPAFLEMVRLDVGGMVIASAPPPPPAPPPRGGWGGVYDAPLLANLFTIPQSSWFRQAAAGELYLGNIQISPDGEPYLIIAVPAPDGGVVAARLHMTVLWGLVADIRFGETGQAYVVNQEGRIVAHSQPEVVLAKTYLAGQPDLVVLAGSASQPWSGRYVNFKGEQVVGTAAPVPGTGWTVVTELSQSEAFAVSRMAWLLLGGGLLLFGVVVMWATTPLLEHQIFQPMEKLRAGVERIGYGDLSHRISVGRQDEIGQVAAAFNGMAGRLCERNEQLAARTEALAAEVAERVRAEAALRELNETLEQRVAARTAQLRKLSRAVECSSSGVLMYGIDGRIDYVNPKFSQMTGFTSEEIIGTHIFSLGNNTPEENQRVWDIIIAGHEWRGEFCNRRKDGEPYWVSASISSIKSSHGSITHFVEIHDDITERKRAEETLRRSEEQYALAVRGANDGLWDWDLKTNEIYFSPRWKSMLGYGEDEIGNSPDEWFNRVHPDDVEQVEVDIAAHFQGLTPHFESEQRIRHKDGTYRWMLTRGLAVRDPDGKAYRMAGSQTDITDRKRAEEQLLHDAFHDALTGLPNRALFMDRLGHAVERARRSDDYKFAVLFLDFDRFKVINDSLGHAIGDQLLISIAPRLKPCLRAADTLARLGGDEFTILLENIETVDDALGVAERIQEVLKAPFNLGGHEVFTSASIGIIASDARYDRPEDILRDADVAMYRAKALGKARYEVFDSGMRTLAMARLTLETDLRRAVERQEFVIQYQPIVSLVSGEITGFEALLRWQHPGRGLILPAEFIPVAEETGLIIPIGQWVLREACRQARDWQALLPTDPPLTISVNLSGKQFEQPDLIEQLAQILEETGLEARSLKLEITESAIVENVESATAMLSRAQALGIQTQMDDFGTGYSSLSYLHRFPINTIKIDRSFISRMGLDGHNSEIVQTIVALAHELAMNVIAEGVETEGQLAHLRDLNCEYGQGYFVSEPLDSQGVKQLLAGSLVSEQPSPPDLSGSVHPFPAQRAHRE